eukprot:252612-Prymnesium_polylepis.1
MSGGLQKVSQKISQSSRNLSWQDKKPNRSNRSIERALTFLEPLQATASADDPYLAGAHTTKLS